VAHDQAISRHTLVDIANRSITAHQAEAGLEIGLSFYHC
jgi:hypothetical protein